MHFPKAARRASYACTTLYGKLTDQAVRRAGVSNFSSWLAYSMYEDRGTPITASSRLRGYLASSTTFDTAKAHRSNHIWEMQGSAEKKRGEEAAE